MKEKLDNLILRLEAIPRYSDSNAEILKEVHYQLIDIIKGLNDKDPNQWHSIITGIYHTEGHIENLDHKAKKWKLDGYKYGLDQTLNDLKDIRNMIS